MSDHFKRISDFQQNIKNNFDLLRLLAAILVIFSHSYTLIGRNYEPFANFSNGLNSFGGIAVACFFTISGFLITSSYIKRHNFLDYICARCLRIFPGLIIMCILTCLFMGLFVTSLTFKEFFLNAITWKFLIFNSVLHPSYVLPDVFNNNLYANVVNGSLWTLPLEFTMYLCVACAGILGLLKRPKLTSILITTGLIILVLSQYRVSHIFVHISDALPPIACFAFGAIACLLKDRIILHPYIAVILIAITAIIPHSLYFQAMFYITFSYCILLLGYQRAIHFDWMVKRGDYSYGVYIYAFPIQQTLVHYLYITDPIRLFLLALPITYILAGLSWHFVEKPALNLKEKLPNWIRQITKQKVLYGN